MMPMRSQKVKEKGQPEKSSMEVSATGETVQWRPTAANATMDQAGRHANTKFKKTLRMDKAVY